MSIAVWCALSVTLPLSISTSQAAETASQGTKAQYTVAPGPLGAALLSFAGQAGINLSIDMDQVRGRSTPGLSGHYAIDEGLNKLLQGTPLQARQLSPKNYTLDRVAPQSKSGRTSVLDTGDHQQAPVVSELAAVTITARTQSDLMAPTKQVTTLERDQIQTLRQGSDSVATLISKAVPGMADSSHTITDYGQTLRGRNMLVLIDGVPLNTNRDSSRNLANINAADVEKIEVLRGSSAIYGSGAAGGIISITTRRPSGETVAETTVTGVIPLSKLSGQGLGGEVQHYVSGAGSVVDYSISLGARHIGASFDANGDRIAPEPSQGDLFDSNVYSASAKLGFKLDKTQRLQLSASHYDAKQDTDYATDPSVGRLPAGTASAKTLKGLQLADQNRVTNTMLGLDYENTDIIGSTLAAQLYYRDFFTRFAPFDARAVSVRGANVDQSMQNSEVFGGRLTLKTPLSADRKTQLTWGADYNHEQTDMPIDVFDPALYDSSGGLVFRKTGQLIFMPPVTTKSLGVFGQLQHRFNKQWSVEGGARYDRASASFNNFVPLSQSRVASPVTVAGGTVNYSEWSYNAGAVFSPVKQHELYASYSQGFELPDIGLQVRNATATFNIRNSNLQAVKTDTVELGWRGRFANASASLSTFYSQSDLGAVQSFNNGLTLARTKERIRGVEGNLDYFGSDDLWNAGAGFTWMRGRELPQGAAQEQAMTGYRIPPLKLTAHIEYRPSDSWSHRLQATHFESKDYRLNGVASFGRRDTTGYTTVDLVSQWKLDRKNNVVVGVENLLNKDYHPLYSQLLRSNNNTSRLPAAGAVLRVSYNHAW